MHILYFDAFSGLSGDMTVGALIDLGVDVGRIREQLARLPLGGFQLRVETREVNGIQACKVDVVLEHEHHGGHDHGHGHRAFRDIRAMIEESSLAPAVARRALAIFTRLAEAEGRVHGMAPEDVVFHEVGAVDSIVDVVATAVGLEELGVEHAYVASLPLGSGIVKSQHGPIPVPAPATAELLRGFPVRIGDGEGEMVTPTGAAIVAALATPGEPLPPLCIEAIGYGAGSRMLSDRPNVLRLVLGQAAAATVRDEMVVIETNIDDANPEIYEYVIEQLLGAGARDVWLTPAQMKKNRPGVVLHVLAEPAARDALASIVLRETTAIGVRFFPVERLTLRREVAPVDTEFGRVEVKRSIAPDGNLNLAPEYESCRRVARERGVPLKSVYEAALAAARKQTAR